MHSRLSRRILCSLLVTVTAVQAQAPAMQSAGKPVPLSGGPRTHTPQPTSAAIDMRDLMTRTYIIADDSMEGRETGQRGGIRSTNYIAGEMRRLGLRPAGDNGTYFQAVPFVFRSVDSTSQLTVSGTPFRALADLIAVPRLGLQVFLGGQPFGGAFAGENVASIWGGQVGGTLVDTGTARGKVVGFALPANATGPAAWQFWRSGDNLARYAGAKAIIIDVGAALPASPQLRSNSALFYADPTQLRLPVILVTSRVAEAIFGAAAARTVGGAGLTVSGQVGFKERPTPEATRNVVAVLPGSDAKLRDEYIAISAHADHVGMMASGAVDHDSIRVFNAVARPRGADDPQPRDVSAEQWTRIRQMLDSVRTIRPARRDSIFNGADDDGSGTVLAMEIAEAFAKAAVKPKRSLLFVFHAAEEKGLYGAQYFSDHPTVPREAIIANVNMDQMGRGGPEDAPPGGNDALVLLGLRRTSTALGAIVESVNARPAYGFTFDLSFDQPGDPSNGWCRSDHYMYARFAIPTLFFVSAVWYIDYHMVSDEPQYVNYPRMAKIGNYIKDVVAEVAALPSRPVHDQPKPNPVGVCRQ